ncbi:hypothetical protein [Methylobacterium oryzihabitans]|jgi:hypothetical protein|uniref:Uncharacterized protein n=1 Tax=Methylobacterium oryzihabitans TaxID=2499852 RepID=A0A437NRF6_9HYPH|nr:hypothetical protein [Methylobacterium oryzihabitans]RVU12574.1 hypothetical protein EOE48_27565 [Methylobacterium oryzihabitans]
MSSLLVVPPGTPPARDEAALDARGRDFLLLTIFVLAQQGYVDRAGILAEALHMAGDASAEVLLARAVLRFFAGDWAAALACLDELDRAAPVERFGSYTLTDRERMRRYLKARCLFELGETAGAREAVGIYLRHG